MTRSNTTTIIMAINMMTMMGATITPMFVESLAVWSLEPPGLAVLVVTEVVYVVVSIVTALVAVVVVVIVVVVAAAAAAVVIVAAAEEKIVKVLVVATAAAVVEAETMSKDIHLEALSNINNAYSS